METRTKKIANTLRFNKNTIQPKIQNPNCANIKFNNPKPSLRKLTNQQTQQP